MSDEHISKEQNAIERYYKLKGRYDKKYKKHKHKIWKDHCKGHKMPCENLGMRKYLFQSIRMKCIGCKRLVGTRFFTKDRTLYAICGDDLNPCQLDVRIYAGSYYIIPEFLKILDESLNQKKQEIQKMRFNLLYGLVTEEQIEWEFNSLKEQYEYETKKLQKLLEKLDDIQKVERTEGTEAKELLSTKDGGMKISIENPDLMYKQDVAKNTKIQLNNMISEFRQLITTYKDEDNDEKKSAIMTDATDIYINQIIPTIKIMRDVLYDIYIIVKQRDKFVLTREKTQFSKLIYTDNAPQIINNNWLDKQYKKSVLKPLTEVEEQRQFEEYMQRMRNM